MKKSRNARNLKRRVKTRKVMRGGEMNEPVNEPVNKDVIDALKKVVDSMKADDEYPRLKKSIEELIRISEASTINGSNRNSTKITIK